MAGKTLTRAEYAKRELLLREKNRRSFVDYIAYLNRNNPKFSLDPFHRAYYELLDLFAHGKIRKLIITCPPQHGKSEGSTRNLPAYMHGLNPDLRICIVSYGFPLAQRFNRAVQNNINTKEYARLFPGTVLPKTDRALPLKGTYDAKNFVKNQRMYDIIGHTGGLLAVGRGGALTGNPVDIGIVDDIYKDDTEANSPVTRAAVEEWYIDTFSTRLHNDSQQLITFTRWHEEDLIGFLRGKAEEHQTPFIEITDLDEIRKAGCDPDRWYFINFPAIKEGAPTPIDPREPGEALWPETHDLAFLEDQRKKNPGRFMSLYQGNPMPREGLLYPKFRTYAKYPSAYKLQGTYLYCDVADCGDDNLCVIAFGWGRNMEYPRIYIKDVYYTNEGVEVTEDEVVRMIISNGVSMAWFESNNGGNAYAIHIRQKLRKKKYFKGICYGFHNPDNKETRILTHAGEVMETVVMPEDWAIKWPEFWRDVKGFKRLFKSNRHDDGPDALTGCIECSTLGLRNDALYTI